MKRTVKWLARLLLWLTVEAVGFWALIGSLFAGILIVAWFRTDYCVRFIGIDFQSIGVFCVFVNIYRVTIEYNLKNPLTKILEWIAKNPFISRPITAQSKASVMALAVVSARGIAKHGLTKGKPIESRVDIIEERLRMVEEKFQNFVYDNIEAHDFIQKEIKTESSKINGQISDVHRKIEKVETSGLGLTVLGALLMLFGSCVGAFPNEILVMIISLIKI